MTPPVIGKDVWYYPPPNSFVRMNDQPLAAKITGIWSDAVINIAFWDSAGRPYNKSEVLLVHMDTTIPDCDYCIYQGDTMPSLAPRIGLAKLEGDRPMHDQQFTIISQQLAHLHDMLHAQGRALYAQSQVLAGIAKTVGPPLIPVSTELAAALAESKLHHDALKAALMAQP